MGGALQSAVWNPVETVSREEMELLQMEQLQVCVGRVKSQVPFYRERLAGIEPGSIQSLADLTRLPFTNKQDLRDNYPFGLFATAMADVVRIHASSGTTGKAHSGRIHRERHRDVGRPGGAGPHSGRCDQG